MSAQQLESEGSPETGDLSSGLGLLLVVVERRQRVALEAAQRDLGVAVKAAAGPVPCLLPGRNLWLSEDRAERQLGAEWCRACPVIAECAAVGAAVPSQAWGVFGGHDYSVSGEGLGELRLLGEASELGPAAEARRDELLLELSRSRRWSIGQLARAARLSVSVVRRVLDEGGVTQQGPELELAELGRRNGSRLRELRDMEDVPAGRAGDSVRARRDVLLVEVWETDPVSWKLPRLAWAAGVTRAVAAEAVRSHRQLTRVATSTRGGQKQRGIESSADRVARYRREAVGSGDGRVAWLLVLCRQLRVLRGTAGPEVASERAELKKQRDLLVRRLQAENARFWTRPRLAAVLGCSPAMVTTILAQQHAEGRGAR